VIALAAHAREAEVARPAAVDPVLPRAEIAKTPGALGDGHAVPALRPL
jgi:hypothetical protein